MEKKKIKIQKADYYETFFNKTIKRKLDQYYEVEFSDKPDFLFYSVYGTGREHYKYQDCVKVFWSAEGVIPDFNECDYAIGSYPMNVGERYLQTAYNPATPDVQNREKFRSINPKNRKFCNFVYSNESNGKGAVLRKEFCTELMKYKHVDCPGKVLNNMQDAIEPRNGKWYKGKVEFIKNYKFTIAFENVAMPGMITEKLIQAFEAGTIPIYWGDPGVSELFNSKAFINCTEYASWDDVIEKIKEIDQDDEKYMAMLLETPVRENYDFDYNEKITHFLCDIIEKGNLPFEKDPLGWDAGSLAAKQVEKMQNTLFYKLRKKGVDIINRIYRK